MVMTIKLIPLLVALFIVSCGGKKPPVPIVPPLKTADADQAMTKEAAKRAFADRGWAVTSESEDRVVGRWQDDDEYLEAEIVFSSTEAKINYLRSDQGVVPAGMMPEEYEGYMENIHESFEEEMARPGKDAAKAVKKAERAAAKRKAEAIRRTRGVLVAKDLPLKKVREAVILELQDRDYTVESEEGNVIVARWSDEGLFYRLKVTYEKTKIGFDFIDANPGSFKTSDGVQIAGEKYIDYMGRLSGSISERLN